MKMRENIFKKRVRDEKEFERRDEKKQQRSEK